MPTKNSFKTHDEYLDWYREYREKNRKKFRKYNREFIKQWRHRYGRARDNVRRKVWYEIKCGRLKRKPCAACGSAKVQAHHTDYSKPLKIAWLCIPHHKIADRKLKKISTPNI